MNYKTILAASGIAVIFSFSQPFSNQLANADGPGPFELQIQTNDTCPGPTTFDCRYVFTAKDGSNKQITMARTPSGTESWAYYDLPIYTKTGVQAGYYYDLNDNLVLMVVYSADKEGKSGAIVSRVSYDYGEHWTASVNITNNQHKFGLAVAPDSVWVAILNNGKIKMWYAIDGPWEQRGPQVNANTNVDSKGLAMIREADDGDIVSVSYTSGSNIWIKNFNIVDQTWRGFSLTPGNSSKSYRNDTAWLKDSASSDYYLAVKHHWVKMGGAAKRLGVLVTTDLTKKNKYASFQKWVKKGSYPISGLWQDDDEIIYILSTVNQDIRGTDSNGNIRTEYESNQNSSMRRRVSMFVVPPPN